MARLPFAFAAGLGINSFLAVSVVGQVTWPEAMGLVVVNGLVIVLLAATGLRRLIFTAVPMELKLAITVGRLPKTRSGKILRGTMKKIADGDSWSMPATIDDPMVLDEIGEALRNRGVAG